MKWRDIPCLCLWPRDVVRIVSNTLVLSWKKGGHRATAHLVWWKAKEAEVYRGASDGRNTKKSEHHVWVSENQWLQTVKNMLKKDSESWELVVSGSSPVNHRLISNKKMKITIVIATTLVSRDSSGTSESDGSHAHRFEHIGAMQGPSSAEEEATALSYTTDETWQK